MTVVSCPRCGRPRFATSKDNACYASDCFWRRDTGSSGMNDTVVKLAKPTASEERMKHVCGALSAALRLAEDGQFDGILILARKADGAWYSHWTPARAFGDWIGRLEITKQRWISSYLEQQEDD
jgi:hypothetical protein